MFAVLASVLTMLRPAPAHAQTYTWDQQALGQFYQQCLYLSPQYWPNNNNWTQAYATNNNCDGSAIITSAPSNWDPTPPVGLYPGGPGLQGVDVIIGGLVNGTNVTGGGNTYLQGHATVNNLTLQTNGSLNLGYITSLTATNVDIQGDTIIGPGSYAGIMYVAAGGSLTKSGGTNTFGFGVDGYGNAVGFEAVNAGLVVKSGTFAMPCKGAGTWLDGTFSVSNNATVLLSVTNNSGCTLGGNITGVGGGVVVMNTGILGAGGTDFYGTNHPGLTLNFPGNMFQWSGGVFQNGPVTNAGVLNLTNSTGLQAPLYNNGTMILADNSSFGLSAGGGNIVHNNAGGIFNIQGNSSITDSGHSIVNSGLFLKSVGAGVAQITPFFNNYGGKVEVDAGTMALNGIYITNATFVVSNGATLDLAVVGGNFEIEGSLTGSGGGTVLMNNGTVSCNYGASLNFPGSLFQWQGGKLGNGYGFVVTNLGTLNVSGPVGIAGYLLNDGMMIQSGTGGIGSGYSLYNNAGAVYDIQNDNGITVGTIYNSGLIKKSAGTGTSQIADNLIVYGPSGSLEVDSGTLALFDVGGNYFTNTALVVSNGATLDFNSENSVNYGTDIEGYLTGSGGGTVLMTNGTVLCSSGATMNFPGLMFQWQGGRIGNTATSSPLLTNVGNLNISGPVAVNGYLANSGTIIQSGTGLISSGTMIQNYGDYQIQNDNGVTLSGVAFSGFNNHGLLEKTAGAGTSVIAGAFVNYGAVQADTGTILFSGSGEFDQNAGTLQITPAITFGSGQNFNLHGGTVTGVGALGYTGSYVNFNGGVLAPGNPFGTISIPSSGTYLNSGAVLNIVLGGPSQFSQLAVKGYIQYGGTLNVALTNGYTPAIGTQFQIITNGSSGYSFAAVNVPHGISVTYSNTGVYLTVTSAVPAQVISPQMSGGNFGFSFGTYNGQSYTVQQNTNLATPNWTFYTNITGNGLPCQILLPMIGALRSYFRVSEP